jgi:hypothetical protein
LFYIKNQKTRKKSNFHLQIKRTNNRFNKGIEYEF